MLSRLLTSLMCASVMSLGGLSAQAQANGVPPEGGFRTQEDDLAELEVYELSNNLPSLGAIKVPLNIEQDGEYTIALYTKQGTLVRIIGQMMELKKGSHEFRWDGLDAYGHLVPAGTKLDVKVFHNPGVKAFYEFTIGSANNKHPWGNGYIGGKPGTPEMRWAGWLGDHSAPNVVRGVGDYVAAGMSLAEQGNNLALMNLQGDVIWTVALGGWTGPRKLRTDGKDIYAYMKGSIMYVPLFEVSKRRDGSVGSKVKKRLIAEGKDTILSYAVSQDRILTFCKNSELTISPFRQAGPSVDVGNSEPQVLSGKPPTEFHISPSKAFADVVKSNGQPQIGVAMKKKSGAAYAVYAFNKPVKFGSVHIGPMKNVEKLEVYMLKSEIEKYDTIKHSPLREKESDDVLGDLDISDMDSNWVKIGEVKPSRSFNMVNLKQAYATTSAMYFKAIPPKKQKFSGWKPVLRNASLYYERLAPLAAKPKVILPEATLEKVKRRPAGWEVVSKNAINRDQPLSVILDYGKAQTFDGVGIYEPLNGVIAVDKYIGDPSSDPASAADADWEEVGVMKAGGKHKLGSFASNKNQNTHFVRLMDRATTRAIRLRVMVGYETGKWGMFGKGGFRDARPTFSDVTEVSLFRLVNNPKKPAAYVLKEYSKDGKLLGSLKIDDKGVDDMAFGDDGQLYSFKGDVLSRSFYDGKSFRHEPISQGKIQSGSDLQIRNGKIVVADREQRVVLIFDTSGNFIGKVGNGKRRDVGKWDPYAMGKLLSAALTSDGDVWTAEESFQPKRIARFSADGQLKHEYFGMARYGGGGFLDPNLKWFYYQGVRYGLDFEKGTSWVDSNYDRPYSEFSFDPTLSTFAHQGFNRPHYINGKRYMTGYGSGAFGIGMLSDEDHRMRPCVLMGPAANSGFLLRKEIWKDEFLKKDLTDHYYLWTDLNDDGDFQRDELQIYHLTELGVKLPVDTEKSKKGTPVFPIGGSMFKDFSLTNKSWKIKPVRMTPGGVPVYDLSKWQWQPNPAAVLHTTFTLAGPTSAKPFYFGFLGLLKDGSAIREGQPYVVNPEGKIPAGGFVAKSSDYQPEIKGVIMNQSWKYAGIEDTDSDLGEVAMVGSNNGYWYIVAARYGVVVGSIFDGSKGTFGHRKPLAVRGTDVTSYKNMWEGWGSNFIRANNGNYYASMGKIWHGIYRVEGLHDLKMRQFEISVPASSVAVNKQLRPMLKERMVARKRATSKRGRKDYGMLELQKRTSKFKLDGKIEDWGKREKFQPIGPAKEAQLVDMAYDKKGLYLAWSGENRLTNKGKDWTKMYHTGFSFEVMIRTNSRNRSRDLGPGDKRIVFSRLNDQWIAVLYDYRSTEGGTKGKSIDSPMGQVKIANIKKLSDKDIKLIVNDRSLGINLDDLDQLEDGFGETPGELDGGGGRELQEGYDHWTAEVLIPWKLLGNTIAKGEKGQLRVDFAVSNANASGTGVERRRAWSNQSANQVGDIGLEATLNPGAWGYVSEKKGK